MTNKKNLTQEEILNFINSRIGLIKATGDNLWLYFNLFRDDDGEIENNDNNEFFEIILNKMDKEVSELFDYVKEMDEHIKLLEEK